MDDEGATTSAAPPHSFSCLGCVTAQVAVYAPAPMSRLPGSVPGTWFAGAYSPWPPPFAPPTPLRPPPQTPPQWAFLALFAGFIATMTRSDFSCPCIIGFGSSPSRCGPSLSRNPDGQTRDLPGSDAIPLHVMWPLTPAGRQHLASLDGRCRTCCLRANENSRPLQRLTFRGSIPHPMQLLCTLRNHCRQWHRNTRYQAGRYPLLGPDFHRLDRTSLRLAHSFDHLIGGGGEVFPVQFQRFWGWFMKGGP